MSKPTQHAFFPLLRRLSDGKFHSGQELAAEFQLSRSSIFNIVQKAQEMGLAVHAVPGRGYKMPVPVEWLDARKISTYLADVSAAFSIRILDSANSTNTILMQAALNGEVDGAVLSVENQHAGKGRRGRQWHTVLGGSLAFSVLYRFEHGLQSLSGLSLAAGLAIARAVNRHSPYVARLKWPNDVQVDFRKLAGILVEVQGDLNGSACAVIGVGLNVRLSAEQRDAVDQAVVDLYEMGVEVGRNQILADCLKELHRVLVIFRDQGFSALREEWMAHDACANKRVTLKLSDVKQVSGFAAGVDDSGAFLLKDNQSVVHAYYGGEISLRLSPDA